VYAVSKPNARKMQYLKTSSESQTPGDTNYQVCEIIASNTGSTKYLPLLATFWSRNAPDYVSDAKEILAALHQVLEATKGRGVVCMEYRYVPATTIDDLMKDFFTDEDIQFICCSGSADPTLVYRQQQKTFAELAETCDLPHAGRLFKVLPVDQEKNDAYSIYEHYRSPDQSELSDLAIAMEYGSLRARCQGSGRPVSAIVLKTNHSILGEMQTLLITSYNKISTRKTILIPILSYISIGDVVTTHKAIRDAYSPSDLQVSKYDRMQLLMTLLHAVLFFEAKSRRLLPPLARFQPHQGNYLRDFVLPEDMERLKHLDSS
jgi:hypothetical protein